MYRWLQRSPCLIVYCLIWWSFGFIFSTKTWLTGKPINTGCCDPQVMFITILHHTDALFTPGSLSNKDVYYIFLSTLKLMAAALSPSIDFYTRKEIANTLPREFRNFKHTMHHRLQWALHSETAWLETAGCLFEWLQITQHRIFWLPSLHRVALHISLSCTVAKPLTGT